MNNSIQIWQISLAVSEDTSQRYFSCLSETEKARANRFRFADDKRRFVVARGTLRHLLAQQLKQTPQAVNFCYGEFGKPGIESTQNSATQSLQFNISHSGEVALCALARQRAVGIDIEKIKPMQRLDSMMARCLVAKEQARVEQENTANQTRAFLQHWTCKEAYLKAIGLGLTQSMKSVEVSFNPPQLVTVPNDCSEGWQLHTVAVPNGYAGALVVAGKASLEQRQWQHVI